MATGPRVARQEQRPNTFESDLTEARSALRQAAERVSLAIPDPAFDASPEELNDELERLTRQIEANSPSTVASGEDVSKLMLRRHLLDLLRGELVAVWKESAAPDTTEMLDVLESLERIQNEIDAARSSSSSADRLFESRGAELAVELAHDLRSPLTSILFLSETLLRGSSGPVNEIQHRQIGIIYSAALALINTASDVIELARGAALDTAEAIPFSLIEILEPVRDMVLPIAEEKRLEVRLASVTPDRRYGYPVPLSRVLLNLTTNGLKFTDDGSVTISVKAVASQRLEFSVRDTGRGIDPAALATLFQPLRRRAGGRRGYQITGTGLGLSICRKLIAAMGGELQMETEVGWGTRFYFELDLPAVE
jgi:signal transduction histidine kinase